MLTRLGQRPCRRRAGYLNVLERNGPRPQRAAPSASGVHPLSQCRRSAGPAGKVIQRHRRQLRRPTRSRQWLARHPRWTSHFTPTSASWLNAVEGFFAKLTKRRLKRGVFRSVVDLQGAINRFIAETNSNPKPFGWTAEPARVLAAIARGEQALKSLH